MRTLEHIDLDLDGLRVLIGENGSGKSSVVEALEILRRTRSNSFWNEFNQIHGGIHALRRHGATMLKIRCTMEPSVPGESLSIVYQITLSERGVEAEFCKVQGGSPSPLVLINRTIGNVLVYDSAQSTLAPAGLSPTQTAISAVGQPGQPSLIELQHALESIEVHVPFDVIPTWVANAHGRPLGVRGAAMIAPTAPIHSSGPFMLD